MESYKNDARNGYSRPPLRGGIGALMSFRSFRYYAKKAGLKGSEGEETEPLA